MAVAISRKCPNCGQVDLTDFSTCRYCSKKYDGSSASAALAKMKAMSEPTSLVGWGVVLLIVGIFIFGMHFAQTHKTEIFNPNAHSQPADAHEQ